MHDAVVSATRAQECTIPCYRTDASVMSAKSSDELALGCVPNLEVAGMSTNTKKSAITRPLNASNTIVGADVV